MPSSAFQMKKLKNVRNGDFINIQEYIVKEKLLDWVRMAYRMVNGIKLNFKNFNKTSLLCEMCDSVELESQCHVMVCSGREEERKGPGPLSHVGYDNILSADTEGEGEDGVDCTGDSMMSWSRLCQVLVIL